MSQEYPSAKLRMETRILFERRASSSPSPLPLIHEEDGPCTVNKSVLRRKNRQSLTPALAAVLDPSVSVAFKSAASTLVSIFLSNEWYINLAKNAFTLLSIRFVVTTFLDYRASGSFEKGQVPRYALAVGLVAAGLVWLDSVFVFPDYVINIGKHFLLLVGATKILRIIYPFAKKGVSKTLSALLWPVRKMKSATTKTEPSSSIAESKIESSTLIVEESITGHEDEEDSVIENEPEDIGDSEEVVKEPEAKDGKATRNVVKNMAGGFMGLANLQDTLAEFQLETIPKWFSKESYDSTQERLNELNKKIVELFKDKGESSSDK